MGCAKCGSSFMGKTAVCSKCGAGFALCNGCASAWKSYPCPACGTQFANWKGL